MVIGASAAVWTGTDPSTQLSASSREPSLRVVPSDPPKAESRGTIDTDFIQSPWPNQWVREFEVGRYQVRWRERVSKQEGLFAGASFEAPLARPTVWDLANNYSDIGTMTPGVVAVRFLEQQPTRQVIQIDVKVLWKTLRLIFEVEQDPPNAIRFRLVNKVLGEYRGLCVFDELPSGVTTQPSAPRTGVELSTWLKPARPVPMGLLLIVERITMLRGVKGFLESCEHPTPAPAER